jgi:hypothetical protein
VEAVFHPPQSPERKGTVQRRNDLVGTLGVVPDQLFEVALMTERPTPAAEKAGLDAKGWTAAFDVYRTAHASNGGNINASLARAIETYLSECPNAQYRRGAEDMREAAAKLAVEQQRRYEAKKDAATKPGMEDRWDRFENYRDAAEYIVASIRALPIPDQQPTPDWWRDIASAPKDDTEILVTGWIYNDPKQGRWQQVASWNGETWATEQAPLHFPTHWMPLPAAPAPDEGEKAGGADG